MVLEPHRSLRGGITWAAMVAALLGLATVVEATAATSAGPVMSAGTAEATWVAIAAVMPAAASVAAATWVVAAGAEVTVEVVVDTADR